LGDRAGESVGERGRRKEQEGVMMDDGAEEWVQEEGAREDAWAVTHMTHMMTHDDPRPTWFMMTHDPHGP
jgi:hypothetical protein